MHKTIRWDAVKEWFDPVQNGSAPDVVVPGTTVADWDALFGLIRSHGWRCEYEFRDERLPLPAGAAEMFGADPEGWGRTLWVWPDSDLEWIIRPWRPDEIVSDVDLHQIQGQERLDAFCRFLRTVGRALGRRVVVYSEGAYDDYPPMLAYEVGEDRVVFFASVDDRTAGVE